MLKLEKKQVKIISIAIALVFMGSVVALALTQTGSGIASAASSVNVGVVEYNQIVRQHPNMQSIQDQLKAAFDEINKDFEAKSAGMTDQEKADYGRQCQQRLAQKEQELMDPLLTSVEDTIKKVADSKGLGVVIEKSAVVYGGTDITQDVISRLAKK